MSCTSLWVTTISNNLHQLLPSRRQPFGGAAVAAPPPVATPETAPTTPTVGTLQIQTTTGQKQMVEVKSLGQYKVTINKTVKTTTL